MNELVELMDKIKVTVEKNVDLEQKKQGLILKLKNVMEDNFKNFIYDELTIYERLSRDLKSKYRTEACWEDGGIKLRYSYPDGSEAYIKRVHNGFTEYFRLRVDVLGQFKNMSENTVMAFSDMFDTEEHAMQTLERIRKGYSVILNKYLEKIDGENAELSGAVEKLTDMLENSSVMEEKEDGTVEIKIGGKTFRGKVTED